MGNFKNYNFKMNFKLAICLTVLVSATLCEGGCGDDKENSLGLCYPPCEEGYHRQLCNCVSDDDMWNTYLTECGTIPGMRKRELKSNTKLRKLRQKSRLSRRLEGGCGDDKENSLGLCYPPCEEGYHRQLCNCVSDEDMWNTY